MEKQKLLKAQKFLGVLCLAALLAGTFTGCKGSSPAAATTSNSSKAVQLSMIVPYSGELMSENSPVLQQIEKEGNCKLNIQWTPLISYSDKFNVIMASNQLPDALIVPDLKSSTFRDAVQGNQFWELSKYFSGYKNFSNIDTIAINNCKINGKLYVLPRTRILKRDDVVYREDWAKKAGLNAPDTLDGIYNMAKNFAGNDYDGNGKQDTIGLLLGTSPDGEGSQISGLAEMVVAEGGFNGWGVDKSGNVESMYVTQPYMDVCDLLRKMYSEGLISKDFPNTKTTSLGTDYLDKEKGGLEFAESCQGAQDTLYLAKKKDNSNLKLSDIWNFTYMKDSKGNPRSPAGPGFAGGIAIPKSTVKSEARLKDILRVMDFLNGKDGQILLNNGIQDRNYKLNADKTVTAISTTENKDDMGTINQLGMAGNYALTVSQDPLIDRLAKERNTYKDSDLINDVSVPLYSQTYSTSYASCAKIIDTAEFKYILGQIDKNAFQAAISQWKSAGGDKMAQEFTADYKKNKSSGSSK